MKHPKDIHCGETVYHCVLGVCVKMKVFTQPYIQNGKWIWQAKDRMGNIHKYECEVDEPHEYLYDVPIYGFGQDKLL